ncbi:YdeI/OmpD-associated family protein [Flammeovirga sp. OC4]|uniref:YdeI/OmpD-associated family protein n=1 Tax=Flammeovirga sp. OC4 TaxID=1382345 RepID=UPI0005C65ABE|nr:YdeI/OmpD-associated family protein [Flammeovirga sp. OC4]
MILLVEGKYKLEKFPGKGGWTYAELPTIPMDKNNPFGWVRVNGFIDEFELKSYKLMPMGNGNVFLPVKAQIRKKIKKEEGDEVTIRLYLDEASIVVPDEIKSCLELESNIVQENFKGLSDEKKKEYVNWIYNARNEDIKAERILKMLKDMEKY